MPTRIANSAYLGEMTPGVHCLLQSFGGTLELNKRCNLPLFMFVILSCKSVSQNANVLDNMKIKSIYT